MTKIRSKNRDTYFPRSLVLYFHFYTCFLFAFRSRLFIFFLYFSIAFCFFILFIAIWQGNNISRLTKSKSQFHELSHSVCIFHRISRYMCIDTATYKLSRSDEYFMKFLPIDWVYWAMNFSYGWICRSSNEFWMSHFLFGRIHISTRSLSLFRSLYPCCFSFFFFFFLGFLLIAMSAHVRPFFPYNSFYTRWVRAVRCMKLELWNFLSVFRHRAQKSTDFYRANNFSYYTPLDYNNVQRILCAPVLTFNALGFGLMYEENDREPHTHTENVYTLFGKFYIVRLDCVSTPYIYLRNILPYSSFSHIFHSRSVLFLICGNIISITHDFSVYNEKGIIFHDVNPSETYFWVKRWIKKTKRK